MRQTIVAGVIYLVFGAATVPPASAKDGGTALPADDPMVQIDQFFIDVYEYPNAPGVYPRVNVTY